MVILNFDTSISPVFSKNKYNDRNRREWKNSKQPVWDIRAVLVLFNNFKFPLHQRVMSRKGAQVLVDTWCFWGNEINRL